ncbi:MAG: NPCBM/NEW2 domain-containing protein [Planctomycetota bacterium]|nr:NPCBM/NEW2 domain-containing protein [Planctomycetota bacterium]
MLRTMSALALLICMAAPVLSAPKAKFQSPTITKSTPGRAVKIDVDITGAKELYLVVTDGGNGFGCDWADWVQPRLVGPKGELKLTELKWKSAVSGFMNVGVNKNVVGKPLSMNGKPVEFGIGTHANSVISYAIPAGYTKFLATGGLDDGGVSQPTCGDTASVQFAVYTEKPTLIAAAPSVAAGLGSRDPMDATAGLTVAEGLEATLFAAEPMLLSPSNIDVDHRGRVWVCEIVNYRHRNGSRKEGDRILILEDTDGDGVADSKKVFYQGRDIDTALGICVLGNRVIVSVAPNVFVFTDENGDGKADKKEVLFTKVGQPQHDHSTHAFTFGPDGKLYWCVGNTGQHVHDKNGNIVVDLDGKEVRDNGKPYFGGMPFRCNLDGSDFEVLAHNFRNNYEVSVDSFGTLWQSDNDDDGNRAVRINFVMEFGNYGYRDEMTGAGWKSPRTGMHEEIPLRHFHLRDPGVVPNLLQTGQGSPTGICVYEGRLLPKVFWDQVIHCDAGPNVVRAYPAIPDGAGYKAEIVNVLKGDKDNWFRPSDVCVAPDGSLIVADWYDPGVGGHRMGDIERGRLFRVAPPKTGYKMPKYDFATITGAIEALKSPNLEARYLAWTALNKAGTEAETALNQLYADKNPRLRARALWLLGNIKGRGETYVNQAIKDEDADIRVTGLRMARRLKLDVPSIAGQLTKDSSAAVLRECAIAIRHNTSSEAHAIWVELAQRHDGKDRWYLEALGIGADGQWDDLLRLWRSKVGDKWNAKPGRDIVWRSRAASTPDDLAALIADPKTPNEEITRYLRAFDFVDGPNKTSALAGLAFASSSKDAARNSLVMTEAVNRLKGFNVNTNPKHKQALDSILEKNRGTSQFVTLVDRFNVRDRFPDLLALAQAGPDQQVGIEAMTALLQKNQLVLLKKSLAGKDARIAEATARAIGNSADGKAAGLLGPITKDDKQPLGLRREAARGYARSPQGAVELLALAKAGKIDATLKQAVAASLHSSTIKGVKEAALKLFPLPPSKNNKPIAPLDQLVKRTGDPIKGRVLFNSTSTCAKCHIVNKLGKEVGPNLSEIGSKLSRHAFYESILYPSAGISHNYETYTVVLNSGLQVSGIITSRTDESVSVKDIESVVRTIKMSDVDEIVKQSVSLMPADIQKNMTEQDLVDVVEYLTTLKKAEK